jgi:hypothetical protein
MLRSRSDLLAAGAFGAFAVLALGIAGWRVGTPDSLGPELRDWQSAAAAECPLLALSLSALSSSKPTTPIPLAGTTAGPGPCIGHWGFSRPFVTYDQLKVADAPGPDGKRRFVEHIRLSRPTYSVLGLRAAVAMVDAYEGGADGYACTLHRSFRGWALDGCRRRTIS